MSKVGGVHKKSSFYLYHEFLGIMTQLTIYFEAFSQFTYYIVNLVYLFKEEVILYLRPNSCGNA